MNWIDIAAFSFLFWGGISGFYARNRKTLLKTAALLLALPAALLFQAQLSVFIETEYALSASLTQAFSRQLVIPVDQQVQAATPLDSFSALLRGLEIPDSLARVLYVIRQRQDTDSLAADFYLESQVLATILAQKMVNAMSFIVSLVLIRGSFFLGESIVLPYRREIASTGIMRGGGIILGIIQNLLILIIVTGFLYPLAILRHGHFLSQDLYDAVFLDWLFKIFAPVLYHWV